MTLADAIRRKGKEDAEAVWRKARADAEAYRAAKTGETEGQRALAAQALAARSAELERSATAEAAREARKTLANAKASLADRLHTVASQALPDFRNAGYAAAFTEFADELPSRVWQHVRVNPADKAIARKVFPEVEVVADPAITGGMEVDAEGGRVRIANTLEARLQAAWPEILPGLMNDLLEAMSHS